MEQPKIMDNAAFVGVVDNELTDGSVVYDVTLYDEKGARVGVLQAISEADAGILQDTIINCTNIKRAS